MRIEAYIRVLSTEANVRPLHDQTAVPGARIVRTKASREGSEGEVWWFWATERAPIDCENEDEGFKSLLLRHKPIFPIIKTYLGADTDVWLEVITHFEPDEDARGLYLSSETIALMAEIGAALDHDVYQDRQITRSPDHETTR
jgi:hypothetical protein